MASPFSGSRRTVGGHGQGEPPELLGRSRPAQAERLYDAFCAALGREGVEVARGRFGARMAVELVNDGPVTIVLDG